MYRWMEVDPQLRVRQKTNGPGNTGWFKANLDTLTNDYDKYRVCTEKIMVDLFSVYPDISFDNNKTEKNNIDFITATS